MFFCSFVRFCFVLFFCLATFIDLLAVRWLVRFMTVHLPCCHTAIHWPDLTAVQLPCLTYDDWPALMIGWGVTSLSLVIRRKTPLPPFQPIKSQARKNCNKFRWIATHFSRAWLRLLSAPCVRFLTGSCVFSACILLSSVFQRKIKTVYATLPSHIRG